MSDTADVVVVGAGIVGAACAEALSGEGLRVVIVESGVIAGGATSAGMGHVVVMDNSEAEMALTCYSRDLWRDLAPRLPAEAEFQSCGTLWVASDEEEMQAVRRKSPYYAAHGVKTEALDPAALAEAEPNLRPGLAGGLLVPDDLVLNASAVARWLLKGSHVRTGCVAGLEPDGVRLFDGSRITAAATVCATGTWITTLLPEVSIRPRKGHLAITDPHPDFVRHQLVELGYLKSAHGDDAESVAFNVQPRKTGQVVIGSSRQFGVTDPAIDDGILRRMLSRAAEYMPRLARLKVLRTWTGFRACTDDRLPLIGPCPDRENVYLATGHEGLGITTSLATARILADTIMGRTPAIDPAPYLPSRLI